MKRTRTQIDEDQMAVPDKQQESIEKLRAELATRDDQLANLEQNLKAICRPEQLLALGLLMVIDDESVTEGMGEYSCEDQMAVPEPVPHEGSDLMAEVVHLQVEIAHLRDQLKLKERSLMKRTREQIAGLSKRCRRFSDVLNATQAALAKERSRCRCVCGACDMIADDSQSCSNCGGRLGSKYYGDVPGAGNLCLECHAGRGRFAR